MPAPAAESRHATHVEDLLHQLLAADLDRLARFVQDLVHAALADDLAHRRLGILEQHEVKLHVLPRRDVREPAGVRRGHVRERRELRGEVGIVLFLFGVEAKVLEQDDAPRRCLCHGALGHLPGCARGEPVELARVAQMLAGGQPGSSALEWDPGAVRASIRGRDETPAVPIRFNHR